MSWRIKSLQSVQRRAFSNATPTGGGSSGLKLFPIVLLTGIGGSAAYVYSNPDLQSQLQNKLDGLTGSSAQKVPAVSKKTVEEVDLQKKLRMMDEQRKKNEMQTKMKEMKVKQEEDRLKRAKEEKAKREEQLERKRKAEELEKIKKAKAKELKQLGILENRLIDLKNNLDEIKLQKKRAEEAERIAKKKAAKLESLNKKLQVLKKDAAEMEEKAKKEAKNITHEKPSAEQAKVIASLEEIIKKLEKDKKKLNKALKKKTKQAEKYQAFLQEKLVPLQQGKKTYEQAVNRYHALEADMQDDFAVRQEKLQEDAERRVESLVEVQKRMKAVDLTLTEMSREQAKRNEILRCRSSVQKLEQRFLDGDSIVNEVNDLKKTFSDSPFMSTVLNQVDSKFAQDGFKTPEELKESFKTVEKKCRASFLNQKVPKDHAFGQAVSHFFSNLLVYEPALRHGEDPDSVLSTTGYWVQNLDLYKALDKLKSLPKLNTEAGDAMNLWISQVEARLNAEQVLAVIKSHLLLQADRTN